MKNKIIEIVKKELRDVVRDKKTLLTMVILPMILYPAMIVFLVMMMNSMMEMDDTSYLFGFTFEPDDALLELMEGFNIEKVIDTKENLEEKFNDGEISAYIDLTDKKFTIYYGAASVQDSYVPQLAYELMEGYRQSVANHVVVSEGLTPEEVFDVYEVEMVDVLEKDASIEMILGYIPTFIFATATFTAIFAAIDMTAGEKERGTLETLLTFPLRTEDIIYGKFLATTIGAGISSILSFISMYGVIYFLSGKIEFLENVKMVSGLNIIIALLIIIVFAFVISAISIILASSKKSFKEAQNATQILQVCAVIPMFFSIIGVEFDTKLALIPFINVSCMLNQVMSNSINYQNLVLTIISNLVFMAIALKATSKLYRSDKILFS